MADEKNRVGGGIGSLLRFHFGLPGAGSDPEPPTGLRPAPPPGAEAVRPLFVASGSVDGASAALSWPELLMRAARGSGLSEERAKAAAATIDAAVEEALPAWTEPQDASAFVAWVARRENDRGRPDLGSELGRFAAAVPSGGRLLPATSGGLLGLLDAALGERRRNAWEAFHHEAVDLVGRLATLIDDPAGPAATAGETAGALADRFLDPAALAAIAGRRPAASGLAALPAERRARLAEARSTLAALPPSPPAQRLWHTPATAAIAAAAPAGWTGEPSEDPCAAAAAAFDREAAELAAAVAARHRARLELAGDFDPNRHGPGLDRLDWRAFSAEERALLPPAVALLDAEAAAGPALGSLSHLLQSGRPVQIVVEESPAAIGAGAGRARLEPGLLAIAHRDVLVAQTAAARPAHALAAIRRAAETGRCALYAVASGADPAAAIAGRAHPLFIYDPDAEGGWERRIDLAGNPEPEADWPSAGAGPFTFADFALSEEALAAHFRAIPEEVATSPAILPFAEWLGVRETGLASAKRGERGWRECVPAIPAAGADGTPIRLAVDRAVALAAQDRLDVWRTLQGLAGLGAARVASSRAREEALAEAAAERERQEARHAAALAAAEVQAAERLASRLTELLTAPEPGAGPALDRSAPAPVLAPSPPFLSPAGGGVDRLASALAAVVAAPAPQSPVPDPRVEALTARLLTLVAPGA